MSSRTAGCWRILPVVVAIVAFVGSLWLGTTPLRDLALIGVALSFFAIVVGIAVLGPLLTGLIGRVLARGGGPSGCSPVVTCSTTRAPRSRW